VRRLAGGLAVIAATLAGARFSERIDLLRFALCWWGVLFALDGAVRLRHGASPLPRLREWVLCCAASVLFWDVFELVNLRLRDWWYVGVPRHPLAAAAFSAICYATVLPAARLGTALLAPSAPAGTGRAPADPRAARALFAAGSIALALALAAPSTAFPLAWVFLWPIGEGILALRDGGDRRILSPLQAWRAGDRGVAARLVAIALPLGLLWEALNWRCPRGWVYTVPHFESYKLFEMPLPGYLGYLSFLLEVGAALALADRVRIGAHRAATALVAVLAVHVGVEAAGRARTTLSMAPHMGDARSLPAADRAALSASGLRTTRDVLRAGPAAPRSALELAGLAEVGHLGLCWAERLKAAGVADRTALASADAGSLAAALSASGDAVDPALVRLWISRARDSR
jgi:hypothetical protein